MLGIYVKHVTLPETYPGCATSEKYGVFKINIFYSLKCYCIVSPEEQKKDVHKCFTPKENLLVIIQSKNSNTRILKGGDGRVKKTIQEPK
jgi:hypothetical protein